MTVGLSAVRQYRTKPIDRLLLSAELTAVSEALRVADVHEVAVSFGWESNLAIDVMWKNEIVSVDHLPSFIANSEVSGIVEIGKSDIFVEAPGLLFTLCHEGDAHMEGDSEIIEQFARRWAALGYAPYEVPQSQARNSDAR